jgi:hypothetical protein
MNHIFRQVMQLVDHMGMREWFWVMAAMIVVGLICLRGFGSRSKY